jgi:hypothetical protein
MSAKRPSSSPPLPGAIVAVASAFVALHLFAIGIHVLAAPSGPWTTPFGPSPASGPVFAGRIDEAATSYYLRALQMTHNYHFASNRPDNPAIAFEVRLKDSDGRVIEILPFPSPKANSWVRYRQMILAQNLGDDETVQRPGGEVIPAPGKRMDKLKIWDATAPNNLVLRDVEVHLLRDRPANIPISQPREWATLVARSYMRHLCREYGAASAELSRRSRQPVLPEILFAQEPPPGTFDTLVSTFEEYRRDK